MRTNWGESTELGKDGTEFGKHNTVYLATIQEIRMGYARFGVRINQIKSNQTGRVSECNCYDALPYPKSDNQQFHPLFINYRGQLRRQLE